VAPSVNCPVVVSSRYVVTEFPDEFVTKRNGADG
jgi:hypothetical protein